MTSWYGGPVIAPPPLSPQARDAARRVLLSVPIPTLAPASAVSPTGVWTEIRCDKCRRHHSDQLVYGSAIIVYRCVRPQCNERDGQKHRTVIVVGAEMPDAPGLR